MPSKVTDFIQTYQGLAKLQQDRDQIEDARESAKVAGLNTFMTLARQTAEPGQLLALVDRFAQLGVGSHEQLTSILQNVTPTQEAITSMMTQRGINVQEAAGTGDRLASETANTQLTGQNQGQTSTSQVVAGLMDRFKLPPGPMGDAYIAAAGARAIGATPGQLVLDHALSKLGMPELQQGAAVGLGTRLSAGQTEQSAQAKAGLEYNWAGLRETSRHNRVGEALSEVELGISAQNAKTKANMTGIPDASNIASMIASKAGILKDLQNTKETPPPALVMNYIGALNTINAQLSAAGVPNEGQIDYTPDAVVDPSMWAALKRRLAGVSTTVKYQPVQQRQKK